MGGWNLERAKQRAKARKLNEERRMELQHAKRVQEILAAGRRGK
jgi:hypothetical protein